MALDVSRRTIVTEEHVKTLNKDWLNEYYPGNWHFMHVPYGMGVHGIHDIIACVPMTVTPEMVGSTIGLFVSIEAKRPGRRGEKHRGMSKHQHEHMVKIIAAGGVSLCCDGEEDLLFFNSCMEQLQHGPR